MERTNSGLAPARSEVDHVPGVIKLLASGFGPSEMQLLNTVVQLSQRRQPRLELLGEEQSMEADVIMIDAANESARGWAEGLPWLAGKAAIWVDGAEADGRLVFRRPIQWSSLPILLTRALRDAAPAQRVSANMAAAVATGACREVLVVDDSIAVRSLLRPLLESNGFAVTDVDGAAAAIELTSKKQYGFVLLDVLMPGMDGYEACRHIKAKSFGEAKPVVIMLTSKSSPFDRIRGKMAGCDAYLTKPIDPADLVEAIIRHCPKPAAETGSGPLRSTLLQSS